MKRFQNKWYRLFCLVLFCLLMVGSLVACDGQANTTDQTCNSIVNVNSCVSNDNNGNH